MNIRVLSCAEAEIAEAMDYYNGQYPGLGYEFAVEIKACIKRIVAFPNAWPMFTASSRRCLLDRFPYAVLYQSVQDEIIVYALMHLKQGPRNWSERLDLS